MTTETRSKVLIIGSGPAGYTAAIYAARANLEPVLVAGMQPGGQLTITTEVENYPGFGEPVQGPWLMEQMRAQAENVGTRCISDVIVSVDLSRRPFRAVGDSGDVYVGDALIICTGAQARWLDIPGEETYKGFGLSACATCDGFFYRDKDVAVIGGGNSATEEALFLTNFARTVTLIHRRDSLKSEKILQDRLFRNPKIRTLWHTVVEGFVGTPGAGPMQPAQLTALVLRNVQDKSVREVPFDGVFVAIGHSPSTELFKGQLPMDEHGYLRTAPDSTATSIPGVFAAGDVKDKIYRQAVTAAGMGCMAALEAERFLAVHEGLEKAA